MTRKKFKSIAIPPCPWHKKTDTGMLQWYADASKRDANGEQQTQCHVCGYWFWEHEFGEDPIAKFVEQQEKSSLK